MARKTNNSTAAARIREKSAANSPAAIKLDRQLMTLYICNVLIVLSSLLPSHFNDLAHRDSCTYPDAHLTMLAETTIGAVILLVAVISAANGIMLFNNHRKLQWPDIILLPITIAATPIVAAALYFISNMLIGLCSIPF